MAMSGREWIGDSDANTWDDAPPEEDATEEVYDNKRSLNMSWSISANGPKDEAIQNIRKQVADAHYKPGTPEGDDIVAAGARIEALANALAPSEKVALSAYGSHSTTSDGISSASFSVSVSRTS